ncbi:helix-turn-helix domain-containing protein [Herbidospora mongoliensis]|uniref:helix-turn-helix domain-containing protein n=1 Tax=Herbidospora mongoliensis TaxID=688067 RepID=UPI000A519D06|nr:helix-turn-helix transcriptional regulator [Herbidospora mongoliensis]
METFGAALRRLRGDFTTRELARRAAVSKSHISDLETGRRAPSAQVAAALDKALSANGELLSLYSRSISVAPHYPVPAEPPRTADYVSEIRDTNLHLIALDSRYGGTGIADVALQAFRSARRTIATGAHNASETDLQAAAGETGEIAAWCLYDGDRLDESRAVTHEAMFMSRLAGDRAMELFSLSHLALIDLHQRHSRDALRIAESVMDPGVVAPRLGALFKIRAARALAQSGDRRRSLETLAQAESALLDSVHPRDPHWTWWLDSSEMAVQRGLLYLELGEYSAAMPHLNDAAHGRIRRDPYAPANGTSITAHGEEWGRAAYNDLIHLFLALAMAEAWSDAEPIAATVTEFTREVVSARSEVMLKTAVRLVFSASPQGGPSGSLLDLSEEICRARAWPVSR